MTMYDFHQVLVDVVVYMIRRLFTATFRRNILNLTFLTLTATSILGIDTERKPQQKAG